MKLLYFLNYYNLLFIKYIEFTSIFRENKQASTADCQRLCCCSGLFIICYKSLGVIWESSSCRKFSIMSVTQPLLIVGTTVVLYNTFLVWLHLLLEFIMWLISFIIALKVTLDHARAKYLFMIQYSCNIYLNTVSYYEKDIFSQYNWIPCSLSFKPGLV